MSFVNLDLKQPTKTTTTASASSGGDFYDDGDNISRNKRIVTKQQQQQQQQQLLLQRRSNKVNERLLLLERIDEEGQLAAATSDDPNAFQACRVGNLNLVKQLVDKANCNRKDTSGRKSSCLHFAAGFGRKEVCEYLLNECDADPSIKDEGYINLNKLYL